MHHTPLRPPSIGTSACVSGVTLSTTGSRVGRRLFSTYCFYFAQYRRAATIALRLRCGCISSHQHPGAKCLDAAIEQIVQESNSSISSRHCHRLIFVLLCKVVIVVGPL